MASQARSLRKRLTPWESRVWLRVRQWRREGLHFRRQVPLGPYIVDFACHRAKLVVELDGSGHTQKAQARRDTSRDHWLEQQGYRVIRIWNVAVDEDMDGALDHVYRVARQRQQPPPSP